MGLHGLVAAWAGGRWDSEVKWFIEKQSITICLFPDRGVHWYNVLQDCRVLSQVHRIKLLSQWVCEAAIKVSWFSIFDERRQCSKKSFKSLSWNSECSSKFLWIRLADIQFDDGFIAVKQSIWNCSLTVPHQQIHEHCLLPSTESSIGPAINFIFAVMRQCTQYTPSVSIFFAKGKRQHNFIHWSVCIWYCYGWPDLWK